MGIEVNRLESDGGERWNKYVERTAEAMPFHRYEALEVISDISGDTLHALVGFKGEEPIGLLPIFEDWRGPVSPLHFVYSPPTKVQVPFLGPLMLNSQQLKQRKVEKRNREFIESCIDWIDTNLNPDYIDIRTTDRYPDARPFLWNDFDVQPMYTYVLDLTPGEEALFNRFSGDARSNIREAEDGSYAIREGGEELIRRVVNHVRRRIGESDEEYHGITPEFALQLYRSMPDGRVRPHELRLDGEYVGGGITLESDDTVYRWVGFPKPDIEFPVNDVLDWHIIREAAERGKRRYDFVGAMRPRLCSYKVKFSPKPRNVYVSRRKSPRMRVLSSVYHQLPDTVKDMVHV